MFDRIHIFNELSDVTVDIAKGLVIAMDGDNQLTLFPVNIAVEEFVGISTALGLTTVDDLVKLIQAR